MNFPEAEVKSEKMLTIWIGSSSGGSGSPKQGTRGVRKGVKAKHKRRKTAKGIALVNNTTCGCRSTKCTRHEGWNQGSISLHCRIEIKIWWLYNHLSILTEFMHFISQNFFLRKKPKTQRRGKTRSFLCAITLVNLPRNILLPLRSSFLQSSSSIMQRDVYACFGVRFHILRA